MHARPSARPAPTLRALAALALAAATAAQAAPGVMEAWQLNVYRDGSSADWLLGQSRLLADGFDNGNPQLGPNYTGTVTPAVYLLGGLADPANLALALRESGSALWLDPQYGATSPNAAGALGRSLRLTLGTSTTDPEAGLSRGHSFSASLRLSLASLPLTGQSFGLRLSDSFGNLNDYVELSLSGTVGGTLITLRRQDFQLGTVTPLASAALLAPAGAGAVVLSLSHPTADSDTVTGSFAYADGSGALMTPFTTFAQTASIFHGELLTRVELRATAPLAAVPEPASWALLAAGGGLLAWRRRRQAAAA